jgi:hypothetical protein
MIVTMRDRQLESPLEATYAQAAFFASLMAPVIAAIGFLGRLGFPDNSLLKWGEFVGLSWFLIHFSYAARKLLRTHYDAPPARWWQGHAPLTLAGLALVAGCGAVQGDVTYVFGKAFAILGTAALTLRLVEHARSLLPLRVVCLFLFALLMGLYAAGSVWGEGFENPLFVENLCNGYAHIDTLYHATLANMLRTYGVCSTGLDGLPVAPYHFGSHWIFARLSNLLDLPVIDFYNLAYPVIFAPFTTFSLLTFAVSVAEIWRGPGRSLEQSSGGVAAASARSEKRRGTDRVSVPFDAGFRIPGLLFWVLVAAGVIGVLPRGAGVEPLTRSALVFASESYGMAISVALLGIAAVSALSRDIARAPRMRSIDVVLGFVFLSALPSIVGLLKISVMMLLMAAAAWFFVRLRIYRYKVVVAALCFALAFLSWDWLLIYQPEYGRSAALTPFSLLKALVGFTWWSYYWLFCFAWTVLFVVLRVREERALTLGELWAAFRERKLLDVEFVLIIAVLGSVPEILLGDYSSTHYFADDQHWLALGLTLAVVLRPMGPVGQHFPAPAPNRVSAWAQPHAAGATSNTAWLDRITMPNVLASLLGLFVVGTLVLNTSALLSGVAGILKGSLGLPPSATSPLDAAWNGNLSQAREILDRQAMAIDQRMRTDKNIIRVLRDLGRLPLKEKRRTLLYIPKTNLQFWDLLHGPYSPKDGPFVAPALSGLAMLDGLYSPSKDDPWIGYVSYYDYPYLNPPYEKRPQPPLNEYLPILKKRCVAQGMNQLIVIEERNGRMEVHKFDCP